MGRALVWIAAVGSACWPAFAANVISGDAKRGEQLFQTQHCIQCHSLNGRGGTTAPDLGKAIDRNYTPAVMAGLMWNHAPEMWAAMQKQGIARPELSEQQAADLFAYFVAGHYFERPGDAGRGKQVFAGKHCADCHGIASAKAEGAPPVVKWESLADPIALATRMWDHAAGMREEFAKRGLSWPEISGQDLSDLLVYLRNLPETKGVARDFRLPEGASGAALFQSEGCAACHTGELALEKRLRGQTITDLAADMWNHAPKMAANPPQLSEDQMREILASIWARQYFRGSGNAERGKKEFTEKNCAGCHNDSSSGAPTLTPGSEQYSDITMISVLWDHGPQMLDRMEQKHIPWPRFTAQQMSDLIAYLNSKP